MPRFYALNVFMLHERTEKKRETTQVAKHSLCQSVKEKETHWPEPYIYAMYDRIFDYFPAKDAVYKPYIYYGSGQP